MSDVNADADVDVNANANVDDLRIFELEQELKSPERHKRVSALIGLCLPGIYLSSSELKELIAKFKDNETVEGVTTVTGIIHSFAFHTKALEKYKDAILKELKEMQQIFFTEGTSFLSMAIDEQDVHWGEHRDMEGLLVLGIAIKHAKYLLPREAWPALPGGVPYLQFSETQFAD